MSCLHKEFRAFGLLSVTNPTFLFWPTFSTLIISGAKTEEFPGFKLIFAKDSLVDIFSNL